MKGREYIKKRIQLTSSLVSTEEKLEKYKKVSKAQKSKDEVLERAAKLPIDVKLSDINYDMAYRAYTNSSFSPEKRAESEQRGYIQAMVNFYDLFIKMVKTPKDKEYFDMRMAQYQDFYLKHQSNILGAKSRTASSMITGPANFPVRRNQKALNSLDNKENDFYEKEKKFETNTRKALTPKELQPIKSGQSDTISLLEKKLSKLMEVQETMKAANKIIKSKKLSKEQKIIDLQKVGIKEKSALQLFEPDYAGRLGFPGYSLTNNNANIKRIKGRISIEKRRINESKTDTNAEETINGVKLVKNHAANRVQIFFDGKPEADVRTKLKKLGFKWAPSKGAWQRFLSSYSDWMEIDVKEVLKNAS